ncbi:MAG: flippase-like domain-containing protein [Bacteroidales bacterium]|nr:flippase-like domain-containing protein [Bacteroidales bacterium]
MKNKFIKFIINFVIVPLTAVLLLYLAFKNINIKLFIEKLLNVKIEWVLLSLLIALIAMYFRGLRWKMLLEPLGYKPQNLIVFLSILITYLANIALPRFGEIARCITLKKINNIPIELSLGTVVTERIIDVITLLFFLLLIFITNVNLFGRFFLENILNPLSNSMLNILVILFIFLAVIILIFLILKKESKNKIATKIKRLVINFSEGIKSILRVKKLHLFLIYTFTIWMLYIFMTYVVFFSIEATSHLTFYDSIFVMALGGVGMSLPVQGGFGTFHWLVILGMSLLNISNTDAMLYATITHESQVLMIIILGSASALIIGLKYKNFYKNGNSRLYTKENFQKL